jgi:transcriptional regulator with XRE-family HTH domain
MAAKTLTPFARAKARGTRINQALAYKKVGTAALAHAIDCSANMVAKWINGTTEPSPPRMFRIARFCEVDVRWLATGEPSPAGEAARKHVAEFAERLPPAQQAALLEFLNATPEPMHGIGVCCYCGCVDDRACQPDGCSWVDAGDHTICSACLQPREDADDDN